jgi:preprotein translocase subunit SecY
MFRRILLVFTDSELRTKVLQILGLVIVARLLAHIPIPVFDIQDISPLIDSDQVFGLLNTISGGAYGRLSFVMLGIGPYITASIVMQLLGVIVPRIRELQREEGQLGQQKVNRWTRYLVVPLSALNAWGILQFLSSSAVSSFGASAQSIELPTQLQVGAEFTTENFWYWFAVIASMTAGSIIMMWIGEIITEFKMGNGISLLILTGIVSRLPSQLYLVWAGQNGVGADIQKLFTSVTPEKVVNLDVWRALLFDNPEWSALRVFVILLTTFIVTLGLVVFVNDAVRRLQVVYSRRGHVEGRSRTIGNVVADLPIKVNMAGVLPIIFAVSFILFPTILSRFFFTANIESVREVASQVETYLSTNPSDAFPLGELPNRVLDVYGTTDAVHMQNAINLDTTEGQDILGLQLSTLTFDEGLELGENPTPEEQAAFDQNEARKSLKNVFFKGTFLQFETSTWNPGFLPEYAIYWDGFLAYTFFYFFLIIFFTYFYTSTIAFKTDDVAENLSRSGAYIPGFRPGQQTMEYLSYISNRLNVFGSIFLAVIAVVPLAFQNNFQVGDGTLTSIAGGTTLLILVAVTIESLKQIEAQATAVDYERFTKF